MAAASLTGVFSPGSPALVESLRTLVLSPHRRVGPGETLRAEFTFTNLGGAPATGLHVRFSQPPGVTHLASEDRVDGEALLPGTKFIDADGAPVVDLQPGAQCRVVCLFVVDAEIEDGTELAFQVAIVGDRTPIVASNVERVKAQSIAELRNTQTLLTLVATDHPHPGDTISVRATIVNTGTASAHDVIVVLPVPEHTSYVPRSARVGGRVLNVVGDEPFDYTSSTVVTERLAPGQSLLVEYQAEIDSPLDDQTRVKATGAISSRQTAEFNIASSEIVIESPPDFENDETTMALFCDDVVTPGTRIPIVVRAMNAGTGRAQDAAVTLNLPAGLVYAPGTAHIDGQPIGEPNGPLTYVLGVVAPGRVIEVGCIATVALPSGDDHALPIEATLRWRGGSRAFSRNLSMKTAARFHRSRNYIRANRGLAHASEEISFEVHLYNDGTAAQPDARLRLVPGAYLEALQITDGDAGAITVAEPYALGSIAPHRVRSFLITGRIASPIPDRASVTLGAILDYPDGTFDLGTSMLLVRSRPHIDSATIAWERKSPEPLRPHQTTDLIVRFTNSGSDTLRDARLGVALPPELMIDRAQDARRERDGIAFAEIAAGTTHEARLTVRLTKPMPRGTALSISGILAGRGVGAIQLTPLEIVTFATPEFARTAGLFSTPRDAVNAGERILYELRMRNDGDGPADQLLLRVIPSNLVVYVPSSTSINGMAIADDGGNSQLWSNRGLALTDIDPGAELHVRFEAVAISPLAAGTPIETRAVVEWEGGESLALSAPLLHVEAQPSLVESTLGTPISIARTFPIVVIEAPSGLKMPEAEVALPSPPLAQGPIVPELAPIVEPQTPPPSEPEATSEFIGGHDSDSYEEPVADHRLADHSADEAPFWATEIMREPEPEMVTHAPEPESERAIVYLDLTPERLTSVVRLLERADAGGGLIAHFFALRSLFPEHLLGASPSHDEALAAAALAMRAPLERLFVRLRMPRLTITGKDLEDREARLALRRATDRLFAADPVETLPVLRAGEVRIEGSVDATTLKPLFAGLDASPIGSPTTWVINAHLIGTTIRTAEGQHDQLESYRAQLLDVFGVLSELPLDEFHRVLTSSVNRTLDDALAAVLQTLRTTAHLAVN